MRYLVLSDIHSNIDALEAALEDARGEPWERLLVLGDLVGYCAEPNAVVERIRSMSPEAIIRGNHDKAAAGFDDAEEFNLVARQAVEWTASVLTPENRNYLASLPAGPIAVDRLVEICHGAPDDEDDYVVSEESIVRALKVAARALCVFGHTHIGVIYGQDEMGPVLLGPEAEGSSRIRLLAGRRYLFNPGSVGQPRDADPRASYGLVDTSSMLVEIHRVPYAIERAQARILEAGLPAVLADRLAVGR
ncbi:MAG: metallophosphoesterase [Vicinamibacterales bacterium]